MEDAATAEISRAQLWQWLRYGAKLSDGRTLTLELYEQLRNDELARLDPDQTGQHAEAAALLDSLVRSETLTEFLTLPAYERLA